MKPYNLDDFVANNAWLIFRVDAQVQDQPIDIYLLMHLPSGYIMAHEIVTDELTQSQADKLINKGKIEMRAVPPRLLLSIGDPGENYLRKSAAAISMRLDLVPARSIEGLTDPLKREYREHLHSQSSPGYAQPEDDSDESDRENAKRMIPDSYDPCSCASGKKYKFCCKKIFAEIIEAMVAAEDGHISEALGWIAKAKAVVGETAEVLCREAIVYSYYDSAKCEETLVKCLSVNPCHPRAHYIRGLTLKKQGDFEGAIKAYETAIENYPSSDHFHLNETYNNLGTTFHSMGDNPKAKIAWERALLFLPSDKTARRNLMEFIYNQSGTGSH